MSFCISNSYVTYLLLYVKSAILYIYIFNSLCICVFHIIIHTYIYIHIYIYILPMYSLYIYIYIFSLMDIPYKVLYVYTSCMACSAAAHLLQTALILKQVLNIEASLHSEIHFISIASHLYI